MPHLRWRDDLGETRTLALGEADVVIGRSPDCDVIIPKAFVSRRHCRIFRTEKGWAIADLGSTGGTFVNRIRVGDGTPLTGGDRIQAGPELLVSFESGPAPAAKKPVGSVDARGGVVPKSTELETTGDVEAPDPEEILSAQKIESSELMEAIREAKSLDLRTLAAQPAATGRHLAALVRVSETLRKCVDVPDICRAALELGMEATGAGRGVVALRTSDGTFERILERGSGGGNEPVRISATFVDKMVRERSALVATDASSDLSLASARSVVAAKIRSIIAAPLWDGDDILGYLYLDIIEGAKVRLFGKDDLNLLVAICHQSGAEIGRLRLGARIRDEEMRRRNLARFLSADVIKHIEEAATSGEDLSFSAKEQEVTILFADLAGFTTIAERMSAAQVKNLLDDYFDRMMDILVDRHGGTLDKYIGDAIMALFGAPFSRGVSVDATHAVAAAVDMLEAVEQLRRKFRTYSDVRVRIGINTGRVVAGMLGSPRRMEYSVIGDVVNVASRLEAMGEPGRIHIGEATYEAVKDSFECEFAGERKMKNRDKPVRSWWVVGPRT